MRFSQTLALAGVAATIGAAIAIAVPASGALVAAAPGSATAVQGVVQPDATAIEYGL
ncbi:hypothetical protein ACIBHX_52270 [Nonomuraea sp. NPDC050536]|uniref:hypothetical protein n=1 Tax=Nonomuraea sp. NPDC050536 TaxID=3364366 RepID=UPI0037C7E93D